MKGVSHRSDSCNKYCKLFAGRTLVCYLKHIGWILQLENMGQRQKILKLDVKWNKSFILYEYTVYPHIFVCASECI